MFPSVELKGQGGNHAIRSQELMSLAETGNTLSLRGWG